jgi:hypothetical protein
MTILRLLLDHPFLKTSHIEMMVFCDLKPSSWRNKCTERMRRLYTNGLVDRFFPPVDSGAGSSEAHYMLDNMGAMTLSVYLGYDRRNIKWKKRTYITQDYMHTMKVFDFKSMLYVLNRQLGVIGEGTVGEILHWRSNRESRILDDKEKQDRLRMVYRTEDGKKGEIEPDALCIYKYNAKGSAKLFFLEIDNATEDMNTLQSKIRRYVECYRSGVWRDTQWGKATGMFPAIIIVMHSQEEMGKLCRYSRTIKSNLRFLFTTYDKLHECEWKEYENARGKTRRVLQDIKINLLENIYRTNQGEGTVAL